ncbi:MAG: hypothetical protein ACETWR_14180 [Anaerolineae bacterium]
MYEYEVVREEVLPGTIEDIRALMHEIHQLQPEFNAKRIFLQGERTPPDYPTKMGRWEVTLGGSSEQRGYILARQLHDGTTKLQFAYYSKFNPIGPQFDVEYADNILKQYQQPLDEVKSLHRQLAQRRSNLCRLEEQEALYGAGECPLRLLNQIEIEQKAIGELEAKIRNSTLPNTD